MATCKDCLHNAVCDMPIITDRKKNADNCGHFKNKDDYAEAKPSMEKLEKLIKDEYGSIEQFLVEYLRNHCDSFDMARVSNLICNLHLIILQPRIERFEHCMHHARENAVSLKKYLEGDMYDSEEAARVNVGCQIENAQRIIDLCDGKVDSI